MFIFVYRLAIDAKTRKGDGGAGGKYPSLLEDFLAGTASMARKRHLASRARGLFGLCLMAQIEVQKVQEVQWVQIIDARAVYAHGIVILDSVRVIQLIENIDRRD